MDATEKSLKGIFARRLQDQMDMVRQQTPGKNARPGIGKIPLQQRER